MYELKFQDVEEVNGGILPALWLGAKVVAGVAGIASSGFYIGYEMYN